MGHDEDAEPHPRNGPHERSRREFKAGDADGEFGTLVLDGDLTGEGGVFKMNVDGSTNSANSDEVLVRGVHEGEHLVELVFLDEEDARGAAGTTLVRVGTENGAFKVKNTETELQGFHYDVERRADGEDGFDVKWMLKAVTPINSSLTETGIAMNRLDYDALRGRDATLRERLGHLRTFHAATGAWVRLDGQTRKDAPIKDRDNGVTIGLDRRGDSGGIYGLYLRYGDGKSHYDTGTSKNRTGTIGAYYTKFFDENLYLDFAADFSRTRKKLSIDGEPGWTSHERIHRNSGTASIEAGRTFLRDRWFVEPRIRFTLGALGKTSFDTDTGAHVSVDSRVAALTRLGAQAGMKINEGCMVNLTADVLHDFGRVKGETTVTKDGNTVKADYKNKRTWAELGAAFSWELKNDFRLHGDVKRALGSGYGNDWRWHVSLEHLF